jgi:hypothetical protein
MVEERLLFATPPGTVYEDVWASGRITLRGLEFIDAYRDDQNAAKALSERAPRNRATDTFLDVIRNLSGLLGPV